VTENLMNVMTAKRLISKSIDNKRCKDSHIHVISNQYKVCQTVQQRRA